MLWKADHLNELTTRLTHHKATIKTYTSFSELQSKQLQYGDRVIFECEGFYIKYKVFTDSLSEIDDNNKIENEIFKLFGLDPWEFCEQHYTKLYDDWGRVKTDKPNLWPPYCYKDFESITKVVLELFRLIEQRKSNKQQQSQPTQTNHKTYSSFAELQGNSPTGVSNTLQENDIVVFDYKDFCVKYRVGNWRLIEINGNWDIENEIFKLLGLDPYDFCKQHYTKSSDNFDWQTCKIHLSKNWPPYQWDDFESVTKAVLALFKTIEERKIKQQEQMTTHRTRKTYASFAELQGKQLYFEDRVIFEHEGYRIEGDVRTITLGDINHHRIENKIFELLGLDAYDFCEKYYGKLPDNWEWHKINRSNRWPIYYCNDFGSITKAVLELFRLIEIKKLENSQQQTPSQITFKVLQFNDFQFIRECINESNINELKNAVEILKQHKIEITTVIKSASWKAVRTACANGNIEILEYLKQSGAPLVDAIVANSWYSVHHAAINGHVDTLKWINDNVCNIKEGLLIRNGDTRTQAYSKNHNAVVDYIDSILNAPEQAVVQTGINFTEDGKFMPDSIIFGERKTKVKHVPKTYTSLRSAMIYSSFAELNGKLLQHLDHVIFEHEGFRIEYVVDRYCLYEINRNYNIENEIFKLLGLDPFVFCKQHYTKLHDNWEWRKANEPNYWPRYGINDYESITKVVLELFRLIEERKELKELKEKPPVSSPLSIFAQCQKCMHLIPLKGVAITEFPTGGCGVKVDSSKLNESAQNFSCANENCPQKSFTIYPS